MTLSNDASGAAAAAGSREVDRLVEGVATLRGQKVFLLKFIQARDPEWVNQVLLARYDPQAAWLDDLEPAFEDDGEFFYQPYLRSMQEGGWLPEWKRIHEEEELTA